MIGSAAVTEKYCNKWMNGKKIRNVCPVSCNYCAGPPGVSSDAPTPFTNDHYHENGLYIDKNDEPCESMNDNDELRSTFCQLDEVNKGFPTTCGE